MEELTTRHLGFGVRAVCLPKSSTLGAWGCCGLGLGWADECNSLKMHQAGAGQQGARSFGSCIHHLELQFARCSVMRKANRLDR